MPNVTSIQPDNSFTNGTTGEAQHKYNLTVLDGSVVYSATGACANSSVQIGAHGNVILELTAPLGTGTSPTLGVTIETSKDNGVTDAWRTVAAFGTIAAAQTTPLRKSFPGCDYFIRANITTMGGTTPTWQPTISGICY